jgi:hypothetical protein
MENEEDGATNLTEAFAAIERFDEEPGDFPSWIPRWDDPSLLKNPRYRLDAGLDLGWNASLDKIPEVRQVTDLETLVLKGLKVTNIAHVFSLRMNPGDTEWLRNIWREISALLEVGPWAEMKERIFLLALGGAYYRDFAQIVEAASRDTYKVLLEMSLLTAGLEFDDDGNPIHEFDFDAGLDAYMEPELVQRTMEAYLDHCVILAWNIHEYAFSLFVTEDRNLGIGARVAKAGDFVCVLFGGKIPFLLRSARDHCIFMEGCYMNSIMRGEAIKEMEAGKLVERWFEIH